MRTTLSLDPASNFSAAASADKVQMRKPVAIKTDASAATLENSKVASQGYEQKSQVSADLVNLQKNISAAVNQLNDMLKGNLRNMTIGMDNSLNAPVVVIRNSETGEVIRQIPNEVVVQVAHSIDAFKGWLHDANA